MIKSIFVLTPQHTGTWFTLAMLKDHPDVGGLALMEFLPWVIGGEKTIEHPMLNADKSIAVTVMEEYVEGKTTLIHSHLHFSSDEGRLVKTQEALMFATRCAITFRDPLLAMLTHAKKNGPNTPEFQANSWVALVNALVLMKHAIQPVFIPVDLWQQQSVEQRMVSLLDMQKGLGLAIRKRYARRWAREWPTTYNSRGHYESKQRYFDGDLDWLLENHLDKIEALQKVESKLRPLFEEIGYRNLLWWSQ